MIFSFIANAQVVNIITKHNEIEFYNEKNEKIEKLKEVVNKDEDNIKHGDLYIELSDGSTVEGKYIFGYIEGKLVIKNKNGIKIYNYIKNLKDGECIVKLKNGTYAKKIYKDGVLNGKSIFKFKDIVIEKNYIYGLENGITKIETKDGIMYMPMVYGEAIGKLKIKFKDGTILSGNIRGKYNGLFELVMPNGLKIYTTFIENVQIGRVIVKDKNKIKVYESLKEFNDKNGYDIFKYYGEVLSLKGNKLKNGTYYSEIELGDIKKNYVYNYKDNYIDGKVQYNQYKGNKLVKQGYYTLKKGVFEGKVNFNSVNDGVKCETVSKYKNDFFNGEYSQKCDDYSIRGFFKNGLKDGEFIIKAENHKENLKYSKGLLLSSVKEIVGIKEYKKIKDGIIYKRQIWEVDNDKFIQDIVIAGKHRQYRKIKNGKVIYDIITTEYDDKGFDVIEYILNIDK